MSWYVLIPLVAFVLELSLALVALRQNWRSLLHRTFAVFLLSMALWSLAIFLMRASPDLEHAYSWERPVMVTFPLIGVFFYHFTLQFSGITVKKRTLAGIYTIAFAFIAVGPTSLVVPAMQAKWYGYAPILGPLFFPYIGYAYVMVVLGLLNLIKTRRHAAVADDRNRAAYMIAGMIALFIGGTSDITPALGLPNYPMGIVGSILFALLTAVAMLKYHLLDIHVVLRRGIAYTLVSTFAIGSYLIMLFIVNSVVRAREIPLQGTIFFILIIAAAFHPLLSRIQRRVDRWFYRERLDHLWALERFSQDTKSIVDVERLASSLIDLVKPALRATSACLLLPSPHEEGFTITACQGLRERPSCLLRADSPLCRWMAAHDDFLLRQDMEVIPQLQALSAQERDMVDKLSAELTVGLKARERLVGILVLGQKLSGEVYSEDDLKLLRVVSRQVAIAFDNAQLYQDARKAYEELKEAQDQLVQSERLRALGEMAGGVAHDFNNLLAAVLGRAQLALDYAQNEKVKADLHVIEQAALDGAETVKRLQDFARVRVDRELTLVNPNELVETALSYIEPRRRERRETGQEACNLVVSLGQVSPVSGNTRELREALTNIMLNAMDAMGEGGTLSISTEQQDGMVVIAVGDTGAGIPAELQSKIFDPFFTTKGPRGTGLGLSVAYGIVRRHQGTIDLLSAPEKGATFYVRLPVASAAEQAGASPAPVGTEPGAGVSGGPEAQPPPPAGGINILVIDDDPEVCEVLRLVLEQMGYRVTVANSGEKGLEMFRQGDYRLVVTDMGLPRLSGHAVARAVKESRPGTPVILITGWGVQLQPGEMKETGIDAVIGKPFNKGEIARHVTDLLDGSG